LAAATTPRCPLDLKEVKKSLIEIVFQTSQGIEDPVFSLVQRFLSYEAQQRWTKISSMACKKRECEALCP
jgi:hypothetical protein